MKKITLLLLLLVASGCTDDSNAKRTLYNSGYTDIHLTGWKPLTCDEKDFSSTGFRAKNPAGRIVTGVVCCGMLFKSCTVRF